MDEGPQFLHLRLMQAAVCSSLEHNVKSDKCFVSAVIWSSF